MRNVKISACQFRVERVTGFKQFSNQVEELLTQVPNDSHYVVFPELFTVGLLTSFEGSESFDGTQMVLLDKFTEDYKELFSNAAKKRNQVIIAGSHLEQINGKCFNTSYIFTPDGKYVSHKKSHLFSDESIRNTHEGNVLEVFDIGPAKIGIAICYEAEIPEVSSILSVGGAEIIFGPSYTITEWGFWRVRHCAQARAIENQVYFVHCPTVGDPGAPIQAGYGRASILSPCDVAWPENGVVAEAQPGQHSVITATVDIDELYVNRQKGAAPTFNDRIRRKELYSQYEPYASM